MARQRTKQDLADLERTRQERVTVVDRLRVVRHGPVRHLASCLVLPPDTAVDNFPELIDEIDVGLKQDIVVACEETQERTCRWGHIKISFEIYSLASPDPQIGYRDPVTGPRRIEVESRRQDQPAKLAMNEWYKAQKFGETYWLYVVWHPPEDPDAFLLMIQNPAKHLNCPKKEIIAICYCDVPASADDQASQDQWVQLNTGRCLASYSAVELNMADRAGLNSFGAVRRCACK